MKAMKLMYRATLMIAAFVFILSLSARSEIKEESTEVGLFGGYHLFENSQNLKDRYVYGGRIGYNFTKHFGIEGSIKDRPNQGGSGGLALEEYEVVSQSLQAKEGR